MDEETKAEFGKIDDKFDKIDVQFRKIDDKFDKIDIQFKKIDDKFRKIDVQFKKIDDKFKKIDVQFRKIDDKFDKIDVQFKKIDMRFEKIERRLDQMLTKKQFEKAAKHFVTKTELKQELSAMENRLCSRFDKQLILMDQLVKEVRSSRNAEILSEEQLSRLDDQAADHENRIRVLEKAV